MLRHAGSDFMFFKATYCMLWGGFHFDVGAVNPEQIHVRPVSG
jgi:hypothetical protein